jgi:uncharacterized protein (DUF2147 family)
MKSIVLAMVVVGAMGAWAEDEKPKEFKEPQELVQARTVYQNQSKIVLDPVRQRYLATLDMLKKQLGAKGDAEGAMAVQKEIEAIRPCDKPIKRSKEDIAGEWVYKDPAWWSRKVVIKKNGSKYQMKDDVGRTYEVKIYGGKMHVSGNGDNVTLEYGDDSKWTGKSIDKNARVLEK